MYSVDRDISEVNNLELLSTVQEEKESQDEDEQSHFGYLNDDKEQFRHQNEDLATTF